jgi:hypothetical protein
MFDSWLTLSGSGMDLKNIDRVMTPDIPTGGHRGPPVKFATYRDPQGRFEFAYPVNWTLEVGEAVVVRSKSLPAFARVEIGAAPETSPGFTVRRRVFPGGIVLTTGMGEVAPVHDYLLQVLAAIRREFKAL